MIKLIERITLDTKALIFDLDGTLADTLPLHYQAWLNAGEELGFHITRDMIAKHSGTPTKIVARILGEAYNWNVNPTDVSDAKMKHYKILKNKHGKIKAINPILDIAKRYHGVLPMAVGTGSTKSSALQSLNDIEAVGLFDLVVTAKDVEKPKPHPETFLRCALHVGVDPKNCLVFEDGAAGIEAAISGGFQLLDVKEYL